MTETTGGGKLGIHILARGPDDLEAARTEVGRWLSQIGLLPHVRVTVEDDGLSIALMGERLRSWMPEFDTSGLRAALKAELPQVQAELRLEIAVAMLGSPCVFEFPSVRELVSCVNMRENIAVASGKTKLAFATEAAERPKECWHYDVDHGFLVRPGCKLEDALVKATQPQRSGEIYSFSCYRATEYVILLGIAQELFRVHPELLAELELQWQHHAIKSGAFHETFLREYGSTTQPLPMRYHVPGDRLWFRNPDPRSSEVTGYEGSWVIYLGNGQFADFWRADTVYTLESKCVEIYHWRNGVYRDDGGALQVNESVVADCVAASANQSALIEAILQRMMKYRDPRGTETLDGGCIDSTREYPRTVWPTTTEIHLQSWPA